MCSLKIIDAHTHIFPGALAEKATASIGKFYNLPMNRVGTPHALVESGDKIGVSRYLVCSVATVPHQVSTINDFIFQKCEKYPSFLGFATLHPLMDDSFAEIDRIVSMGLRGIKLHADFQRFDMDDPVMFPIYERLQTLHLPVLMHAGDDRYDFSSPKRIRTVAERFPALICIAAHFGGYQKWQEAQETLKLPNVYFDTCSSLFALSKEDATGMISHFGADHFMFGTDFPMWDHEKELERFLALDLPEQTRDQILWKTFESLFGA